MDIKDYSYVLAVADEKSITRAAKRLYISQPSLSMFISGLENRLGFPLFVRVRGEMVLTEQGEIYVEYARKVTALDALLTEELQNNGSRHGRKLRLGVTATRAILLLPKLFAVFRTEFPDVELELYEDTSKRLEEMLMNRTLDLAILNEPMHPTGLQYLRLEREEFVVVLPSERAKAYSPVSRPDTEYPWIDLKQLQDESFILLKEGQRLKQAASRLLTSAGLEAKVLFETRNIMTAYQLCAEGAGVFFATDTFCQSAKDDRITFFSCNDPPQHTHVVAAYLDERLLNGPAKKLITILQNGI